MVNKSHWIYPFCQRVLLHMDETYKHTEDISIMMRAGNYNQKFNSADDISFIEDMIRKYWEDVNLPDEITQLCIASSSNSVTPSINRWGEDYCDVCNGTNFVTDVVSNDLICTNCGTATQLPPTQLSYANMGCYTYKKKNIYRRVRYLKKLLNSIQGHCMRVPQPVINFINELKRREYVFVSWNALRKQMAANGLNKYYSHLIHVGCCVDKNMKHPQFTSTQLRTIQTDFLSIESQFMKLTSDEKLGKKSIIGCQFLLKKIFEYRGYCEFMNYIIPSQCLETEVKNEAIWKIIYPKLKWLTPFADRRRNAKPIYPKS